MKRTKDVMSTDLISVPPTMDLTALAKLLARHRITGVPVTDAEGVIVGVVSQSDLTRARASEDDLVDLLFASDDRDSTWDQLRDDEYGPRPDDGWWDEAAAPSGLVVADVMNRQVHSIEEEATIPQLARTMLELGVRRLLVTAGDRFVGIVSSSDLVRAWIEGSGRTPSNLITFPQDLVKQSSKERKAMGLPRKMMVSA